MIMNFYKTIARYVVSHGLATQVIIGNINGEFWYYPKEHLYINIKIIQEIIKYHNRTILKGQRYRYLELRTRSKKIVALPLDNHNVLIALIPSYIGSTDFLAELRVERVLSKERKVH